MVAVGVNRGRPPVDTGPRAGGRTCNGRVAAILLGDADPAEPVPGHGELTVGRARELVAARLARLDTGPEAAR